ncbi:MAG: DUF2062 domain-containing protein [Nitrospirae bacterium]|nr:MAG: DUF2062 domain-containing protein [Nitrospirota bacterium]
MISYNTLKEKFRHILHLGDSPQRTALAFALGTFIAFSPTYGLHTLTALFCAWAFRLNLVAVLAGAFINNPWTILPIIGSTMGVGLLLVPVGPAPAIDWNDFASRMLWDQFLMLWRQFRPYLLPFALGHLVTGIIATGVAYIIAYQAILRFRAHKARTRHLAPPPPSC